MTHNDGHSVDGAHLSDEQLLAWVDGTVPSTLRADQARHLETCATCRDALLSQMAIHQILRAQPQAAVPRSFQLTPELAGSRMPKRHGMFSWVVPALPALRASTLVLFLAFASVTGLRIVQDEPNAAQPVAEQGAILPTPTTVPNTKADEALPTNSVDRSDTSIQSQAAPDVAAKLPPATSEPGDSATDSSAGGAYESAPASSSEESGDTEIVAAEAAPASPTATPSPTPLPTATVSPSPTPSLTATPGATLTSRESPESGRDWLPDLQWILGGFLLASVLTMGAATLGKRNLR